MSISLPRGETARDDPRTLSPDAPDALYSPPSQVACETGTKTGMVMVFGEITTKAEVDFEKVRPRAVLDALADPEWVALVSLARTTRKGVLCHALPTQRSGSRRVPNEILIGARNPRNVFALACPHPTLG